MLHTELEVHVELAGETVRVGELRALLTGGRTLGSTRFRYDSAYVARKDAYAIDPALPLGTTAYYSGDDAVLAGAFQDVAPDAWGRQLIEADLALARQTDESLPASVGEFDYLTLASDEMRMGALRFRSPVDRLWLGQSTAAEHGVEDLDEIAAAAARFETHEATDADLQLLGAPGSSAGGARPKVTVRVDGSLRMIKLPSVRDGRVDGEAWEFVAMHLGRRAGIRVQSGELVRMGSGKSSLALDRFDRDSSGARLGYMSARTAMELGDSAHGSVTYEDLADATDRLTGGQRPELRELFKRVALTVLINNVDDHWKNHGFLRNNASWRLSPSFDVNPSRTRGVVFSRPISAKDDPRNRDIRNLVASADVYGLSRGETARALSEVLEAVLEWRAVAHAIGIRDEEIEAMSAAFSEQQQDVARREISRLGGI